ncbi:ELAS-like protein [Mya arenaria]|uniref:ELAS-like protein n=1 Tax=Mya arenaria TaxID=6604 RepID=A0ABY7DFE8_MYAAR|nr:ELAS-like protein [Mya arenaria]
MGVLVGSVTVADAAHKVDAHYHAQKVIKERKLSALDRRELPPLDATELFGMTAGESLETEREAKNVLGTRIERMKEKYLGVDVYDIVVTVRKTKDGHFTGDASGNILQGIEADLSDTEAELSDEDTLKIAIKAEGDHFRDVVNPTYTKFIYLHTDETARLVNRVSYLVDGEKRPIYIIDLKSGEVLQNWQGLSTYPCCNKEKYTASGGNIKMGKIMYGDMPHCLTPTIDNGICYLENDYVRVVDMLNSFNNTIVETASFPCDLGYGDEVNGAFSPAIDAFFYGTVVAKMYEEWFDSKALKEKIVLRVHFGDAFENAFWNGVNTTFGDGDQMFHPLTSLDVVSHEIAHGVTEQGSGLEYRGESGGMNEAFSDIMGEASEEYLLNPDFMVGQELTKTMPYLREFESPDADNRSISYVTDMTKHLDTHFSSGVFRRVFWVIAKIHNVPVQQAAKVFLYANRMYWHSTADFFDCSCGVLKAAIDLGLDTYPYHMAFDDVGLKRCDVTKHVFSLNNNVTQSDIQVSNSINPTFKIPTPLWAKDLIISAHSDAGVDVQITVTKLTYEFEGGKCAGADYLGSGTNQIVIKDVGETDVFMKLSLVAALEETVHGNTTTSVPITVDLTAGYTCDTEWGLEYDDFMTKYFFKSDCNLPFEDDY